VGSVRNAIVGEGHWVDRRRSWLSVTQFLTHCTLLSLYLKHNHYDITILTSKNHNQDKE